MPKKNKSQKFNTDKKMERVYKCKAKFLEVKAEGDEEGIVEAYVSVFGNVDSYGDIIEQGAFAKSLAKKVPVGVWSHNWDQPIAKTLEAKEDSHGLYIKGQLVLGVQKAREAYELMKAGVINEFSIGFFIEKYEYDEVNEVRIIKEVRLIEWSPVLAGANDQTNLINIKGEDDGKDEEENDDESDDDDEDDKTSVEDEKDAEDEETEDEEDDKEDEDEETDEEKKAIEEKAGKVLSQKNHNLVQKVVDGVEELQEVIKNILAPLKSLLEATEDKKGEKVEAPQPVDKNVLLRIRRKAKQVDKINETILRISK